MKHRPGYTLLELVISMTIVVTLFVVVTSVVVSTFRSNQYRNSQINATNQVMNVVRSLTSLLRQAQTSPTGAYPIIAAANTSFTFYAPMNGGPAIQQIRLFQNGTSLQMGVIQPVGNPASYPANQEVVSTVLTGLRNTGAQPLFYYYDGSYTGTQAALNPIVITSIRVVKLSLIYDADITRTPGPTTIELMAEIRNLKDNY